MTSQGDDSLGKVGLTTVDNFPDYEQDKELFTKFINEHTILVQVADNDDEAYENNNEDEGMEIPNANPDTAPRVHRMVCYRDFLQRIKDRRYYMSDTNHNQHTNATSTKKQKVFILEIPLPELRHWDAIQGGDLADRAAKNTVRYIDLFSTAIDAILEQMNPSEDEDMMHANTGVLRDSVDILHEQRLQEQQRYQQQRQQQQEQHNQDNNNGVPLGPMEQEEQAQQQQEHAAAADAAQQFPGILMRKFELRILPRRGRLPPFDRQYQNSNTEIEKEPTAVSLRQVRAQHIGQLVTVSGMVVRSSDVKPACVVATYSCDNCGVEIYQEVAQQREYMPIAICPNCKSKGSTLLWQSRGSKFVTFQEIKLQELPHQVPMGHVPRSLRVLLRGGLVRHASPGDVVTIDGVFLPQRVADSFAKQRRMGGAALIATTYLEAQEVLVHKKSFDATMVQNDTLLQDQVWRIATSVDPVGRLARSLAPEIFGHEDIKRALLLQLVSGCTRSLPDGMRIRGDLHILLMGDPGVAKSQLLKHVASIAPRGVYTTGKGSSGVGLTAAVTRDMATGEMALEGGALVLADRGICCIDEFDKMDESDRTAIHEVMEQQTVSIAKAGIVATLNARTSVLAAANPLYGRYHRRKTLSENINLPNSLLSRFDLLFLILDVANIDKDTALARHVTLVHQNEGQRKSNQSTADRNKDDENDILVEPKEGESDDEIVLPNVMREYISQARQHHPVMPPDVAPYVVEAYVSLRQQQQKSASSKGTSDQTVMTARQLLSILRLSQALARLRFSDFVAREDVDEAIRLTHQSKSSLNDESSETDSYGKKRGGEDVMSRIFRILRDCAVVSNEKEVELQLAEAMVLRKGFTSQQLQACLEEYEALNVIHVNNMRTHVYFV